MVQDILSPNLKAPSIGDKLSDKWLGTNKVDMLNTQNQYELQKAVNVNKYAWNVAGMTGAGINPLIASGNLGSVSNSQSSGQVNKDTGIFLEDLAGWYKEMGMQSSAKFTKEILKDVVSSLLKAF